MTKLKSKKVKGKLVQFFLSNPSLIDRELQLGNKVQRKAAKVASMIIKDHYSDKGGFKRMPFMLPFPSELIELLLSKTDKAPVEYSEENKEQIKELLQEELVDGPSKGSITSAGCRDIEQFDISTVRYLVSKHNSDHIVLLLPPFPGEWSPEPGCFCGVGVGSSFGDIRNDWPTGAFRELNPGQLVKLVTVDDLSGVVGENLQEMAGTLKSAPDADDLLFNWLSTRPHPIGISLPERQVLEGFGRALGKNVPMNDQVLEFYSARWKENKFYTN